MKELSPKKHVSYYIQIYHLLKQMILNEEFKAGQRINETQLAKKFGVSKSPVREAIRILENEGLLVVRGSRVFVYKPSVSDMQDVYFCRMALESFAVKLTTEIATDMEIEEIDNLLTKTEKAIQKEESAKDIISLNDQFHNLILKFTKNKRLQKQVNDLKGLIYYFRVLNFKGANRAETILYQHRKIFYYMEKRQEEKAFNEMINHLKLDVDHLLEIMPDKD